MYIYTHQGKYIYNNISPKYFYKYITIEKNDKNNFFPHIDHE